MEGLFDWLEKPHPSTPSMLRVIWWWEIRRIPYNLIIGALGIIALLLHAVIAGATVELGPGEDVIEPVTIMAVPLLLNVLYTGGWILEILLGIFWRRSPNTGPALFILGLDGSLLVLFLPSATALMVWAYHSI